MMEIRTTKRANLDLDEIFNTIYTDNKNNAKNYINSLLNFIQLLATNPEMGKECKYKGLKGNCRVIIFDKQYLIIYTVFKNSISIGKILNSKQNY